jgi:hypothetical protein
VRAVVAATSPPESGGGWVSSRLGFDTNLTERLNMKIIKSIPTWGVILLAMMSVPSFGQVDLAGAWNNPGHMDWLDHGRGPDLVDYSGIPINEAARAKALSYTAAVQTEQERQCE